MTSITLYDRFDLKMVRALGQAREIAINTTGGLVDGEHLLYGISVVGLVGRIPITDSLLVAAGLTKTALLRAIDPKDTTPSEARTGFSPFVEQVWEMAAETATRYGSVDITAVHVLYALIKLARRYPKSSVRKLIVQVSPHLSLDQMVKAIDDLLTSTDRDNRVKVLDRKIAKDTVALSVTKGERHANIYMRGTVERTEQLDGQIARAELALKVTKTVRATHMYLQAHK